MTKTITERPMLFSGPLVRAILDGSKTQTRRPIKTIAGVDGGRLVRIPNTGSAIKLTDDGLVWNPYGGAPDTPWVDGGSHGTACPYGKPGDRLWVRETFSIAPCSAGVEHYPVGYDPQVAPIRQADEVSDMGVRYRATWDKCHSLGWKPSIHMPRWASRIDLELTGVRVERVQDITDGDAKAEGSRRFDERFPDMPEQRLTTRELGFEFPHRSGFAVAWDEHYSGSWLRNDWVWVIEFREVQT